MASIVSTRIKLLDQAKAVKFDQTFDGEIESIDFNESGLLLIPGMTYTLEASCRNNVGKYSETTVELFYTLLGVDIISVSFGEGEIEVEGRVEKVGGSELNAAVCGVIVSLYEDFKNSLRISCDEQDFGQLIVPNLLKGFSYYVKPFVIDNLGRESIGDYEHVTVGGEILEYMNATDTMATFAYDFSNNQLSRLIAQISREQEFSDYDEIELSTLLPMSGFDLENLEPATDYYVRLAFQLEGDKRWRYSNITNFSTI